jgi:hypothetical protein
MVYTVYEATVKNEAAYTAALPEVDKYIKNNGGTRIAGGFNKARLAEGKTPVGNAYVIIRWESMSAFDKGRGRRHQGMDREECSRGPADRSGGRGS